MREHRVPMLSAPLRRYPDPELSADPRIYTLLTDLRTLDVAPLPRAHFRAELRSQLVAVAPRLVAEGVAVERPLTEASRPATTSAPARHAARPAPPVRLAAVRSLALGRPVAIVTAIVAVFALLLGSAVFISKHALPGDALYSLKRANETVQLSLADGPTAKSKAYLNFAGERADEVAALLKRATALAAAPGPSAGGGISAHTASLVDSTLSSGDDDVRNAAQLLGSAAVNGTSTAPLSIMTSWAPGQLSKLQSIVAKLPAGPLQDHASASAQRVSDAMVRAQQLTGMVNCSCLKSGAVDDLGPVPCQPCTSPQSSPLPTLPSAVPVPGRTTGATPANTGASGTGTSSGAGSTDTASGTGSDSAGDTGSGSPSPKKSLGITLPTLPQITFPSKTGTKTNTSTCVLSLLGLCIKVG
jgi:hypothetical protein